MADVFLSLGANEGDREANMKIAIDLLKQTSGIGIIAASSLYETKALGVSDQPDFINCVVRINTKLEPHALLKTVKAIEETMGRQPDTHMQPRPIDIDILLYDDIDISSEDLRIPHSRLTRRRFVLEPLLEIEPDAIDPVTSTPLVDYMDDIKSQEVIKMKDRSEVWDA